MPTVTFVVPCYKLAHYLRDSVESILAQEYGDFEILIMDDCSPDNTPAVAASLSDPRIRYVRNNPNLGHLRNYNKGINLARGRYLWLLSADDRLRSPRALGNLVALLDASPNMTFAFSPGVILGSDGRERSINGDCGETTKVYSGAEFFRESIVDNNVCTPGAMTRTDVYRRVGLFPTDLPYAGEWYLWLRFALMGPVGYCPEPGVHYRKHDGSNTAIYLASNAAIMIRDEVEVRWRIRAEAARAGNTALVQACDAAIADDYARRTFRAETTQSPIGLSREAVLESLEEFCSESAVRRRITSRYYETLGDRYQAAGQMANARRYFRCALGEGSRLAIVGTKLFIACFGGASIAMRRLIGRAKGALTGAPPADLKRRTV
jgi:glycosyltransferase involved in cell wall biosynthesis